VRIINIFKQIKFMENIKTILTKENFTNEIKKIEFFLKGKVFSIVKDEETTSDIIQSTYMKAWENIHKYNNNFSPSAWLSKIATNLAIDHIRKNKHHTISLFDNVSSSDNELNFIDTILINKNNGFKTPLETLIGIETKIELNTLIRNNCSYSDKKLLLLFYKKDIKIKDCAIILNTNENTIKTKLRRILIKLKNNKQTLD
jgi:RNA polymerase sigma factor (sigma-70 family)